MAEDSAIAYQAASVTDADLVVGLLRASGVHAFIDSEIDTVFLDGYVGEHRVVQVRVLASVLERARSLIENARVGGAEEG